MSLDGSRSWKYNVYFPVAKVARYSQIRLLSIMLQYYTQLQSYYYITTLSPSYITPFLHFYILKFLHSYIPTFLYS